MADGEDGAVGEDSLLHNDTDVDGCFCDTSMRDANFLDETVVLVQQQCPKLLDVKILHNGMHVVIDAGSCSQVWPFFGCLCLATLA